tara:strand:+ start:248 stop:631 length:384 start_codon:yes stop_codon:yes gene_type:complete
MRKFPKDNDGNSLTIKENNVFLNLKRDKYPRRIGQILNHSNGKISYFKDEEEIHIYRKANAWSIPYTLAKALSGSINIRTEKGIYRITAKDALEHGSFLHFKTQGIEKKIYIPIEKFTFEKKVYDGF